MYGSIFNLKPKKGKREELINHLKINEEKPDGGLAWYVLDPDNNGDLVAIAIFKDKESFFCLKKFIKKWLEHLNFFLIFL